MYSFFNLSLIECLLRICNPLIIITGVLAVVGDWSFQIRRAFVRAVLGLMWTRSAVSFVKTPFKMAALSEYENAMFLELMDDDGLFVSAK